MIDQVLKALTEHPRTIAGLTRDVPPARLQRSAVRGQWSVNDVVAHLRSCSDMWGGYIRTIVAEDHPTIKAVNPTTWIKSTDYPELEFAHSFRAYRRQRSELLAFLKPQPQAAWSRTATVTGAGRPRERSMHEYAVRLANHERSHVKQIGRLLT